MTMRRLLLSAVCLLLLISACGPNTEPAARAVTQRLQCFVEGALVFDQRFDRAEVGADGRITVWLRDQSAVVDGGDCRITH